MSLLGNYGSDCKTSSCVVSCPPGWERFQDHCYFFSNEEKSWPEAEETCVEKHKGHLASVPSEQVHKYLQGKDTLGWVGGVVENLDNPVIKDSKWVWTDCSEWDFDLGWEEGEPSKGLEKCVEYVLHEKKNVWIWNNLNCGNNRKFVCSKKVCTGTEIGCYITYSSVGRVQQQSSNPRGAMPVGRMQQAELFFWLGGDERPLLLLEYEEAGLGCS